MMNSKAADKNDFWAQMAAHFDLASQCCGGQVQKDFLIDGLRIKTRFAGQALVSASTQALSHLETVPGHDADLTICSWDSRESGVGLPPCPWPLDAFAADGNLRTLSDASIYAAVQPEIGALSVFCPDRGMAFYRIADAAKMPSREQASPFKAILHWWLREKGLIMIHAAAVGTEDGGALIIGHSGSGKSTASLSCLESGMSFLTDDRCLLSLKSGPRVHCIFNAAKLWPEQTNRFPKLFSKGSIAAQGQEKALIFIHQSTPERLARELPIQIILLGQISGQTDTTLSQTSPVRVLRDLVPSSMIYQPGAAAEEMKQMAELVRLVPCLGIQFGSDISSIPPRIRQAIRGRC